MAMYHPISATCRCGTTFSCHVARTLNARRSPDARERILDVGLHRVVCPGCKATQFVERPFSYVDPDRNAVFFVKPRGRRVDFKRDSKRLEGAAARLPAAISKRAGRQARVVYGLDELREKLAAQDLELDDRTVELLKVLIVYEHPFLTRRARLQLFLTGSQGRKLRFVAYHHNRTEGWELFVPVAIVDDLKRREPELRAWVKAAHKGEPLHDIPDAWVNFRRWTARYSPLETLRTLAAAIREGEPVNLAGKEFQRLVKRLPRGPQLPSWAKRDLRTLFEHAVAKRKKRAQDALLEVRFNVELDDEWAFNERPNDIDTIWQLLATVPVTNVEGNTELREINLVSGDGGVYGDGAIEIGEDELGRRESFEDVLRHEVGHAVHEQRDGVITPWLERRFGWRMFDAKPEGVEQWVEMMGGWGSVKGRERDEIVQALVTHAGPGSVWGPGRLPRFPAGHAWRHPDFGPRIACEKSKATWYESWDEWHRTSGNAFFVNYYYATFMVVSAETLDRYVARMPDSYAAMSHYEFFAEIYALYYDVDDPDRSVIADDAEVSSWLDRHVGRPDPENPGAPGRRKATSSARRRTKRK